MLHIRAAAWPALHHDGLQCRIINVDVPTTCLASPLHLLPAMPGMPPAAAPLPGTYPHAAAGLTGHEPEGRGGEGQVQQENIMDHEVVQHLEPNKGYSEGRGLPVPVPLTLPLTSCPDRRLVGVHTWPQCSHPSGSTSRVASHPLSLASSASSTLPKGRPLACKQCQPHCIHTGWGSGIRTNMFPRYSCAISDSTSDATTEVDTLSCVAAT